MQRHPENMEKVELYLSLGSNQGDRELNIEHAVSMLNIELGKPYKAISSLLETEPWGFESDNSFLNAVCGVCTDLSPEETLRTTQEIERTLGRLKKSVNGVYSDRIIDIDILLFDDWQINTPELTIPHPLMWERDFVKIPLKEIAPDINSEKTHERRVGECSFTRSKLTTPAVKAKPKAVQRHTTSPLP